MYFLSFIREVLFLFRLEYARVGKLINVCDFNTQSNTAEVIITKNNPPLSTRGFTKLIEILSFCHFIRNAQHSIPFKQHLCLSTVENMLLFVYVPFWLNENEDNNGNHYPFSVFSEWVLCQHHTLTYYMFACNSK